MLATHGGKQMSKFQLMVVQQFYRRIDIEVEADDDEEAFDKADAALIAGDYDSQLANADLIASETEIEFNE